MPFIGQNLVLTPSTDGGDGGGTIVILNQEASMKSQFQSTEALAIVLTPFVDKTTGEYITGGTDVVTLTIERPNSTPLSGGPHLATYDSTVDQWTFSISTGSYLQGAWKVKAVSNDANALPQWRNLQWGDYVETIASIKSDTASTLSTVGSVQTTVTELHKIAVGRWKIANNQLTLYDTDEETPLRVFDLLNDEEAPSMTKIFERVPA